MRFNPLPLLLLAVGTYFLIRLRFFFILHPVRTLRRGLRAIKGKRARRSFSLALAGTLGVGNVFGVAVGIMIGGPGTLFWLFFSMIFAMVIKYCEVVISSDNLYHGTDTHGGIYYVLRTSLGRLGVPLSALYSLCVLLLSLVMGGALQSGAMVGSVRASFDFDSVTVAAFVVFVVLIGILGNSARLEKITAFVIPLTTIIYILLTLSVIIYNSSELSNTVKLVFSSAFSPRSAFGGCLGFLLSLPVREGFARGILSNEAGAGTSSMAHTRSGLISPSTAGILGIFEVWFDTGLICMLTGFAILLSVPDPTSFTDGMTLVSYSVGNLFGVAGKHVLTFTVLSFAFATVICWYYYGTEAWGTLFGKRKRAAFLPLFLLFVFLGCFFDGMLLVTLTDMLMLLASLITLFALMKSSDRIKTLSELGGAVGSVSGRLDRFHIGNIKGILSWKGAGRR